MIPQNSKIVVIDDNIKEVKNLLTTLNRRGIAFNYFKGDKPSELPVKPMKGVRLMFLDFVLGTDGQSPKNKISYLMKVLKTTIASDNGPFIILAWTKHDTPQDDLLDRLKQEIMNSKNFPRPQAILNLEKQKCMKYAGRIAKNIEKNLNDKEAIELLIQWEGHAAKASSAVLSILSGIARPEKQDDQTYESYSTAWCRAMERHIYRIAESNLGQNIKPDKEMLIAAQMSLTELFRDNVESFINNETRPFNPLTKRIKAKIPKQYNPEERAIMNTSFLLITRELKNTVQPGSIYLFQDIYKGLKCDKKNCDLNKTILTKQGVIKEFYKNELKNYPKKNDLIKETIPVMIEITPECDYAQKNWKNGKMLLGILWPDSVDGGKDGPKKLNGKEYIYKRLPVKYKKKIYYLTFNAQQVHSISFKLLKKISPILRARKELLVDIQHWYSKQISRPGKIEF